MFPGLSFNFFFLLKRRLPTFFFFFSFFSLLYLLPPRKKERTKESKRSCRSFIEKQGVISIGRAYLQRGTPRTNYINNDLVTAAAPQRHNERIVGLIPQIRTSRIRGARTARVITSRTCTRAASCFVRERREIFTRREMRSKYLL